MDDRFMRSLKREPDPRFAARLRERLGRQAAADAREPRRFPRLAPAFAGVLAAGLVAALFVFPSVRASAQAVLDLFRVRNFAPVAFDPERMERLRALDQKNAFLVFDRHEVLEEPGPGRTVSTEQEAESAAGFPVITPTALPEAMTLRTIRVEDRGAARFSADPAKLRGLLEALGIDDVTVPQSLAGQWVTVRKPPVVFQKFESPRRHVEFIQAPSPQVELPPGAQLGQLAEIGMRVLGVEAAEARRLAGSVDWHSTLLVPVPMNAASFRSVQVNGDPGLLLVTKGDRNPDGTARRDGTMLLWSSRGNVYAMSGSVSDQELMRMAESAR